MGTLIDPVVLVDDVMWRGGLRDRARAEAALEAVLDALASHLAAADRAFIAEQLPPPYTTAVQRPTTAAASRPSDLYAQLATRDEVSLGAAVEQARAACAALAAIVGDDTRSLLLRRLPPDWAALFAPVAAAPETDVPASMVPGHGQTLATGRPGSSRPLSEAEPPPAQPDSVAAANPHADRKLSSAGAPGDERQNR